MKFSRGQEITLREDCDLTILDVFPVFGKVYTVSGYPMQGHPCFQDWLSLEELDPKSVFDEEMFEPLVSDEQLEDDLMYFEHPEKRILKIFLTEFSDIANISDRLKRLN